MRSSQHIKYKVFTIATLTAFSILAQADESDPNEQVKKLKLMVEQLQQQRLEQDKQMDLLTKELVGVENQLSQSKIVKAEEKGTSKGAPVLANFKDGVSFEDGSGNWKFAMNGRVQADYRQFSPSEVAADTYSLRRARLGGTVTFYKDYIARVEGEFAGANTSLTYGYIDINKFKSAKIRLGQFKPYYGLERTMSTNFTDFQERSIADALLGNTFDRGIMVFGAPAEGFTYSVASVNGAGGGDENNNLADGKDTTARVTINPAEWAGWQNAVIHLGGFYAEGQEGSRRQSGFIPTGQGDARGLRFFETTCSNNAVAATAACGSAIANGFNQNLKRTRSGLEAALAYGPLKLQSEYIALAFDGDNINRQINANYVSLVWNVTGESFSSFYKEGVFGRLIPKNNYNSSGAGWGALQVGVRYDQFDATDFKTNNQDGTGVLLKINPATADGLLTATNKANELTLGANWIINPNVRFVANYVHTNYDTPVSLRVDGKNYININEDNALTMRAQFDF